jgi:hypothetical protein
MGFGGPGSSTVGHPGGGGDEVEGFGMAALRPAYCSGVVGSSFIRARPGLARPSVLPLLCRANDCLSVVEVGSSRMAARLFSLVPKMSCTSIV